MTTVLAPFSMAKKAGRIALSVVLTGESEPAVTSQNVEVAV